MAKGVIPSQGAWSNVSKATRQVLREPIVAQGATRKKIFTSGGKGTLPVPQVAGQVYMGVADNVGGFS